MWALENYTPFAAERAWVRDRDGAEVWIVAVRGTFSVFPDGTLEIAEEQEEVCMAPVYMGDPGKSSLRYDSDLLHTKLQTDVVLHGHAYAPKGQYARRVDVAMKVGPISKKLRVFGDRRWERGILGMKMTRPKPFEKMPLTYERAFGGWDQKSDNPAKHSWEPRNPVGTGFGVQAKHLSGEKAPNVEYPQMLITSWNDRPQPAGFAPVAGHWQPRLQFAGTYDTTWEEERQPLLPSDFDERFYQSAPADQQAQGFFQGGELVELFNLTPQGYLRFRLPVVKLNFETHFADETVTHSASLHSVIIEPDYPRLIMVWHTSLPCHFKVLKLMSTAITDREISMPCCK